jgi:hypothetical protein
MSCVRQDELGPVLSLNGLCVNIRLLSDITTVNANPCVYIHANLRKERRRGVYGGQQVPCISVNLIFAQRTIRYIPEADVRGDNVGADEEGML